MHVKSAGQRVSSRGEADDRACAATERLRIFSHLNVLLHIQILARSYSLTRDVFTSFSVMESFTAKTDTLPKPQLTLLSELGSTPREFVLYGGTAVALQFGHRLSVHFDFFSNAAFVPDSLYAQIPYLAGAEILYRDANTLTCSVDREGPVKVSYFGGLRLNRVDEPRICSGPEIKVASPQDLLATKLKTILDRAELKDYLDIAVLIDAGFGIASGLAAAKCLYGARFSAMTSLKALTFFSDGDLARLPAAMQDRLLRAVAAVDIQNLPATACREGVF